MSRLSSFSCLALLLSLSSVASVAAYANEKAPINASQTSVQKLQRVDSKLVCMVTDMVFPRDQIPIKVGKKTYYGCCENCKERLGKDQQVRNAIDPVSGKSVDKASAVIGAKADGGVIYFENEANFNAYQKAG